MHILIAEDDPVVRTTLGALIRTMGQDCICHEVPDGLAALAVLERQTVDLAFIDINMPAMNGLELLKQVHEMFADVLVVIITGQPSYEVVLDALRLGASDFLPKPFTLNELRLTYAKLMKEKALREHNLALMHQAQEKRILESLSREMDKRMRDQRLLHILHRDLGNLEQREDFYPLILKMAQEMTRAEQASFLLFDKESSTLELMVDSGGEKLDPVIWEAAYQVAAQRTPIFTQGKIKHLRDGKAIRLGISLPMHIRGELFGVLNVTTQSPRGFDDDDLALLSLLAERSSLTVENLALYESMTANLYDTLRALVTTLEARDPYSGQHSERVTKIAVWFAQKLGLPPAEVDSLEFAGALHDIGKVGIPDAILLKPGKLNPQEMEIIRTHPQIGEKIVAPLGLLPAERTIILYHHERWDGMGYPNGLGGEEIPLLSRILAVADTFDALTSNRPYRRRWPEADALEEVRNCAGTQFDPELAHSFVKLMAEKEGLNLAENMPSFLASPCQIFDHSRT